MSQRQIQYWLAPAGSILDGSIPPDIQGPFAVADISQMVSNGTVFNNDLVCPADGSYNWMEVETLLTAASYGEILYYDPGEIAMPPMPPMPQPHGETSVSRPSGSLSLTTLILVGVVIVGLFIAAFWVIQDKGDEGSAEEVVPTEEEKELYSEPRKKVVAKSVDFILRAGETRLIELPVNASTMTIESPSGCKYVLLEESLNEAQVDTNDLINIRGSKKRPITVGVTDRYLFLSPGARSKTSGRVEIK